ncbi:MAG: DUF1003 domain-containing protein [Bauldia sp.]|uniref:DUF1003 domain-containing protein n=1 Tax=Bauldia sp. TaxID=2575872 RepID=UPI001DA21E4A|nr:DUF1003 domain-containing protein [Bauldia sp.]MCB1494683.1 DUF1003 domain-containing protein [Bauldia sp.]
MSADTILDLASRLLELDKGDLTAREKSVIERAARRLAVSRNVNVEFQQSATFGQRIADRVAAIGGSWRFIIGFAAVVVVWVAVNSAMMVAHPFDPYPYILLNLFLSLLAAIQAPIILMSQNRAAARDRLEAAHDYEVNLKAEIEIAALHAKIDEIRTNELATLLDRTPADR